MLKLNTIKAQPGATHKRKRLGRGSVPVTDQLPVRVIRVSWLVRVAVFVQVLKAVRCLFIVVYLSVDLRTLLAAPMQS